MHCPKLEDAEQEQTMKTNHPSCSDPQAFAPQSAPPRPIHSGSPQRQLSSPMSPSLACRYDSSYQRVCR